MDSGNQSIETTCKKKETNSWSKWLIEYLEGKNRSIGIYCNKKNKERWSVHLQPAVCLCQSVFLQSVFLPFRV